MPISETKISRSYNQEDIQQILHLAIATQVHEAEFTHEQLVEIATELDISPESLQLAEQEWQSQQGELRHRQDFNTYRHHKLKQHFGKYAIANSFLIVLNFLSAGTLSWSLYILLLWGLGLGLKTWNTYQIQGEDYEKAFQQWHRQKKIKQSINTLFNRLLNA